MSEKYRKHLQRFEELIKEFNTEIVPKKNRVELFYGDYRYEYPSEMYGNIQEWLMKCESIINLTFGKESLQMTRFLKIRENNSIKELDIKLLQISGLLKADLNDLEKGFLLGQEFIIANEVFDSVLEEAKFFIFEQKTETLGRSS